MQDVLFIQFAREPLPGLVKTRMLPELSPEQACELHRELVYWTSQVLTGAHLGRVELSVAGNVGSPLFQQCEGLGVKAVNRQVGKDLGERMYNALAEGLERFSKVILVGSDSPQIDRDYLQGAISALDDASVVLGPAQDGGYVLIAVRDIDRRWFEGVEWGSANVYAETLARFVLTSAQWQQLEVLQDIDRPEDLPVWRAIVENRL
ncbi:MAG: TIGR04282 family arsenosugar biosynthesis glycosyltransferase [Halioglobus sp.]